MDTLKEYPNVSTIPKFLDHLLHYQRLSYLKCPYLCLDPKKDDFFSQEQPIIKDIPIVTTLDSHHHNSIPQRSFSGTNSFQPSLNYPRNQGAGSFTGNFQSNYNKNNGVIWNPNTAKLNQDYLTAVNNFNLKQQWLYQQQHTTTEKPGNVQKFHIVSTVLLPPLISTDAAFNQFIINNEKPQSVVPLYRGNTPQIGSVARRCDKCRLQPAVSPFKNTGRVDNPKKIRVDDKLEDLD